MVVLRIQVHFYVPGNYTLYYHPRIAIGLSLSLKVAVLIAVMNSAVTLKAKYIYSAAESSQIWLPSALFVSIPSKLCPS